MVDHYIDGGARSRRLYGLWALSDQGNDDHHRLRSSSAAAVGARGSAAPFIGDHDYYHDHVEPQWRDREAIDHHVPHSLRREDSLIGGRVIRVPQRLCEPPAVPFHRRVAPVTVRPNNRGE
jgi:hypothetical protein